MPSAIAGGPARHSSRIIVAAAGQKAAGPTCRSLLGLKDSSWEALLQAVPTARAVYDSEAAPLCQELAGSRAQVVGSEAAGTRANWATCSIVIVHPKHNPAKPSDLTATIAKKLPGIEGYSRVVASATHVELTSGNWLDGSRRIRLMPTDGASADMVQLLDPNLSPAHRTALSSSTVTASTAFLQQQPALFKLAARVVKKWVADTLQLQELAGPGNR